MAELRRDDAPLTLATAHGTKGLEFDDVAVIGLDEGRFPSARSLADAPDPERALEEERRLAYVAWTRARQSLTLMYDPAAPSPFLLEAFSREELGLPLERGGGHRSPGRVGRESSGAVGSRPRVGAQPVDRSDEVGPHGASVSVVQPARLDAVQ